MSDIIDYHFERDEASRHLNATISRLSERVAELEGALSFYANPFDRFDADGDRVRVPDFYSELQFGETAEMALNPVVKECLTTATPAPCIDCNGHRIIQTGENPDGSPIGVECERCATPAPPTTKENTDVAND